MKPIVKWAGGKRWLIGSKQVEFPDFEGHYIEPFLGGGAVFFHLCPDKAILSDLNPRLIDTYLAIQDDWEAVWKELHELQKKHSKEFYYEERARTRNKMHTRAAQFLYLNRTCFNGLYRENLQGKFNVPIGTKNKVIMDDDDFEATAKALKNVTLENCDFEATLDKASDGDFVFVDPPYTTAHNTNGFVKYNQNIFSWDDQIRLKDCIVSARDRGAKVMLTNAHHDSIIELYSDVSQPQIVKRSSVISGKSSARSSTTEVLYVL